MAKSKTKKPANKTKAEIKPEPPDVLEIYSPPDELVDRVLSLSRDGLNRGQIHRWADDLPEKLSREMIDASIAQAAIFLANAGNISSDIEAGRSIARLHDLYARLHQTGDLRGCLAIQKELTKMLGLANTTQKQHDRKMSAIKTITMEIVGIAEKFIHPNKNQEFIGEVKTVLKAGGLI